jgi:hypothetical protein
MPEHGQMSMSMSIDTGCTGVNAMQLCQPSQQLVRSAAHSLRRQPIPATPAQYITESQLQWQLESAACSSRKKEGRKKT